MTELWRWSAARLARGIASREISSREALNSVLERVEQVNPELNAIVEVLAESALIAADAADAAIAQGLPLGPLHGVPVTTKINVDQVGLATTNGLVSMRNNIAWQDSPVVENLRKAGAVLFGRTNTPAFSWRWATDNALHGRTLNPWSRDHTPGGSSGGASAAVASGMGPVAHGNDLAGSIRYPAYCTGIVGLRPSFGRVPAFLPSSAQERPFSAQLMSVQGPLARRVADLRLALEAMSAGDPRDPWWVPAPLHWPKTQGPIRVALTYVAAGVQASAPVVAALRRAAAWLEQAGYQVEEVDPPRMAEAAALWDEIGHGEALVLMTDAIANDGDDGIRTFIERITRHTPRPDARSYMRALARRSSLIRDWTLFMLDYPLVLGPVSADLPFTWGLDVGAQHDVDRLRAAQGPQFMVPLLGFPAASVPCGVDRGLPVGVQLIGARFREDMVLDAAEAIEAAQPEMTPIDPWSGEFKP